MTTVRSSSTRRPPEFKIAYMLICSAIASGTPVVIWYGKGLRIVSLEFHGHTDSGVELVHAFQHDGASESGHPSGLKTFVVAKIQRIELWDAPQIRRERMGLAPANGITRLHCKAG